MTTTNTPRLLKACPFCKCAMRIESNRDWHRIFGDHTEACLFDEDVEQMMVPATPEQLALLVECWNDRPALTADGAVIYQYRAINGEWIEVTQEQYDGWVWQQVVQGLGLRRRLGVIATADEVSPFGTFTPGDSDQNADGVWTAGIHVGAHGNKIEVHDSDRKTAEALRDAICTAVIGKALPADAAEQVTLHNSESDQRI